MKHIKLFENFIKESVDFPESITFEGKDGQMYNLSLDFDDVIVSPLEVGSTFDEVVYDEGRWSGVLNNVSQNDIKKVSDWLFYWKRNRSMY